MDWTEKQILETLRLIEASDYDEVKLETGNFKLHVRKNGAPAFESASGLAPEPRQPRELQPSAAQTAPAPATSVPPAPAQTEAALPPGLIAIRAPVLGTFYRAPAPHAPPFVETGANVKPDDTVCLIEVMKLFNTIKAGVAGKVVKVLAQNASTVKKDEVLLWIEPGER